MDSDGSNCLQLTSNKLGTVKSGPSWSLDGKKIACVIITFGDPYENIWILNLKEE
jgi:Tol biopolymer transport system component